MGRGHKSREHLLEEIGEEVRRCKKCELWKLRRKAVPGEGPGDAKMMIVGQSPGRKEDEVGRPFVGPSGKYLNRLLEKAGLRREEMFITSVLHCFLPSGARVKGEHVEACVPYLLRQIEVVRPKVMLVLGAVAAEALLGIKDFSEARGKWFEKFGARVLVTYHPAAGMRFSEVGRGMEGDLEKFAKETKQVRM